MSSEHSKATNRMQRRFDPYFKKCGLSASGRVYSKIFDEGLTTLATIELESTRLAGQFNIELSIFVPEVYGFLHKYPLRSKLRNVDCCIRLRFSDLINGYGANWWPISSEAEFVSSFMKEFEVHGISFLNRFSSREKILEEYISRDELYGYGNPPKIVAAMICLRQGDRATASRLLFEQASQTDHKGHRDYVLELAREHELLPKLTSTDFSTTVM
jgi:hypothetical protein